MRSLKTIFQTHPESLRSPMMAAVCGGISGTITTTITTTTGITTIT